MRRIVGVAGAALLAGTALAGSGARAQDCIQMDQLNIGPGTFAGVTVPFPQGAMTRLFVTPFLDGNSNSALGPVSLNPTPGDCQSSSSLALDLRNADLAGVLSAPNISRIDVAVCIYAADHNYGAVASDPRYVLDLTTLQHAMLTGPAGQPVFADATRPGGAREATLTLTGPSLTEFVVGGREMMITGICVN